MQALSAYSFDDYALMYGDMELLPVADTNATNMMLQAQSGKFRIAVTGNPNAFQQALQSKRTFIIFLVMGVILLFAFFSVLLANSTSKPIRELADRYGIGLHEYNEYLRLENAFLTLEQENKEALFTAKQQLLRMLILSK